MLDFDTKLDWEMSRDMTTSGASSCRTASNSSTASQFWSEVVKMTIGHTWCILFAAWHVRDCLGTFQSSSCSTLRYKSYCTLTIKRSNQMRTLNGPERWRPDDWYDMQPSQQFQDWFHIIYHVLITMTVGRMTFKAYRYCVILAYRV